MIAGINVIRRSRSGWVLASILTACATLYRQAFELQLKNMIRCFVALRANYVDGRAPELRQSDSEEYLKNKLGHDLHKLLDQVKKHYTALDLPEPFPKSVENMIVMLHEADRSGTAFRCAGSLPETKEYVDFPDLATMLDKAYTLLSDVMYYAEDMHDSVPTLDEATDQAY
ncbi:hypothetical protein [Changpingibacter yushuensis]|uniref:hypothetical protein n=1 Tax=Changpingibacter yushuensis TaxID=2758440 RepID=UPI0015F5A63E|nr:hypothetical protein [Changpingibacter yushuensis]